MSKEIWHYEKDGKVEGPVTEDVLRALVGSGEIRPHTLVWAYPMDDWALAAEIEGLRPHFPPAPPPLPHLRQPPPLPGAGRETDSVPGASPFASAVNPGAGRHAASPPERAESPHRAGGSLPGDTRAESNAEQTSTEQSEGDAWSRFAARTFDYILITSYWILMLTAFAPAYLAASNGLLIVLFAIFSWVFVEALLLSIFGTTPGKYLLGIRLEKTGTGRPSFPDALARSFGVWLLGEAAGIPVVNLLAWHLALNRLTKNGVTAWDENYGFTVTRRKPGILGVIVFIFLIAVLFVFLSAGMLKDA